MEFFQSLYRRVVRLYLYIRTLIYAIAVKRKIEIRLVQVSGSEEHNFWWFSYQVKISLPSKRMHLEVLRAAPSKTKADKVFLAVQIAEDICREQFLPPTPAFLKVVEEDVVSLIIKEN